MANTFRTDVDYLALYYLKSRVLGVINPFSGLWYPGYCQTAPLAYFSRDPYEGQPSLSLTAETPMNIQQLRNIIMSLGDYYSWIGTGHYGLLVTNENGSRYDYAGRGYFYFNGSAPGASGLSARNISQIRGATPTPSGDTVLSSVGAMYNAVWNVINVNKDSIDVDLTVCHSSCHTSCHGSRGRR